MARMRPPKLPEAPPPLLRDSEVRAVLTARERDRTFHGRRDHAVLMCFLDTGIRRGELVGLKVEDVDLDMGTLRFTGKGSRTRHVSVGAATVRALDRYIRARAKHTHASGPALWLGKKGALRETAWPTW